MDYKQALAQVKKQEKPTKYMVVRLDFSTDLVLPYQDGMTLLAALENAEVLHDSFGDKPKIVNLDKNSLNITFMSQDKYRNFKISQLLNVSIDDVEAMEQS